MVIIGKPETWYLRLLPPGVHDVDHFILSLVRPSPFDIGTPIPKDALSSLDVLNRPDCIEVLDFLDRLLEVISRLSEYLTRVSQAWYLSAPSAIRKSTCRAHVSLLSAIMQGFGMEGKNGVAQFLFGCPMLCSLSQEGVFAKSEKLLGPLRGIREIYELPEEHFCERAKFPATNESIAIGDEILEQKV